VLVLLAGARCKLLPPPAVVMNMRSKAAAGNCHRCGAPRQPARRRKRRRLLRPPRPQVQRRQQLQQRQRRPQQRKRKRRRDARRAPLQATCTMPQTTSESGAFDVKEAISRGVFFFFHIHLLSFPGIHPCMLASAVVYTRVAWNLICFFFFRPQSIFLLSIASFHP